MVSKVQGLDRLLRQLADIPKSVSEAAEYQLSENAYELAQAIKSHAPVATGALAESVNFCAGDAPDSASLGAASGNPDPLGQALTERGLRYSVFAGDKRAFYARWVEFGTRAGTKGDKVSDKTHGSRTVQRNHPGTNAQPFFYPTIRARMPALKSAMGRAVGQAAKKSAQKR
jgi:HK97 gp10 family phage protein